MKFILRSHVRRHLALSTNNIVTSKLVDRYYVVSHATLLTLGMPPAGQRKEDVERKEERRRGGRDRRKRVCDEGSFFRVRSFKPRVRVRCSSPSSSHRVASVRDDATAGRSIRGQPESSPGRGARRLRLPIKGAFRFALTRAPAEYEPERAACYIDGSVLSDAAKLD